MTRFVPNLDVPPTSQRKIRSQLGATPEHFVLYGGTALALTASGWLSATVW